ncbi:hypothetical protein ACHAWF_006746 [Thalassiosira exigua]
MAAALSFLAATLPALLLLPKQAPPSPSESAASYSVYKMRRDGTRSVHFRVVYAGLALLGMWVVTVSLMELREDAKARKIGGDGDSGGATDLHPSALNKTLLGGLFEDDGSSNMNSDEYFALDAGTSYTRSLLKSAMRSSSAPERHWGSAFFLLLLWWGPALSLLVIPPRKESSSPFDDGQDGEEVLFEYGDEYDGEDGDGRNSIGDNDEEEDDGDKDEEETFLQDELGLDGEERRRSPSFAKGGDGGRGRISEGGPVRNATLLQMLRTCTAWLMAWTFVILVGGGTVMTNNIGQMTEALGLMPDLTPASLALFSAAQGASRVMTGIASELALGWKLPSCCGCISPGARGVPRPAFLIMASLLSAAAHFVLAVSTTEGAFVFGVTLSGVAFGMVWPMMVLITGEVFGTRHVGANYMFFDGFSSAAGTLLLSKFVAQEVYDEHIAESHGDPGIEPNGSTEEFKCFGAQCIDDADKVIAIFLFLVVPFPCAADDFVLLAVVADEHK